MCSFMAKLFPFVFILGGGGGALLLGIVRSRIIKSYGWGVFFRYTHSEIYGPMLSPNERRMQGAAAILLLILGLSLVLLFACSESVRLLSLLNADRNWETQCTGSL